MPPQQQLPHTQQHRFFTHLCRRCYLPHLLRHHRRHRHSLLSPLTLACGVHSLQSQPQLTALTALLPLPVAMSFRAGFLAHFLLPGSIVGVLHPPLRLAFATLIRGQHCRQHLSHCLPIATQRSHTHGQHLLTLTHPQQLHTPWLYFIPHPPRPAPLPQPLPHCRGFTRLHFHLHPT